MDSERDRRKIKALLAAEKAQAATNLAKALTVALTKELQDRTGAERTLIKKNAELAKTIEAKIELKRRKKQIAEERASEVVDPPEVLEQKIQELCSLIREATAAANSNSSEDPCWSPGRSPLVTKQRSQANLSQQPAQASADALDNKGPTSHGPVLSPAAKQEPLSDGDASSPDSESQAGGSSGIGNSVPSPKRHGQRAFNGGGVVVHTGAGLSTTAGIPDFRGPNGVWTLQSKGQQSDSCAGLSYERVVPTPGHMVLAAMHGQGLVKHVVSQNVDGLHLRSGIPKASVSELHGCVFQEQCKTCGAKFLRSFDVTVPQGSSFHRHKTGRRCGGDAQPGAGRAHRGSLQGSLLSSVKEECDGPMPGTENGTAKSESGEEGEGEEEKEGEGDEKENPGQGARAAPGCGGILLDTIVHFNECLDADELATATEMSTGADLALCLGSSFKVPPANKLPKLAKRVVVVNLQWTPLDRVADLKIHGRLDHVLTRVAEVLGVQWAPYSPLQDPILGERFLKLQENGEETLASTLFMKNARASQPQKDDDGAGKAQKKKRRSIYAQPKRMKRISFPQPGKC